MKVKPEIIRSSVHHKSTNDGDDKITFNLNGNELEFRPKKFSIVTECKCSWSIIFNHDPKNTSNVMSSYFPNATDKVLKAYSEGVLMQTG